MELVPGELSNSPVDSRRNVSDSRTHIDTNCDDLPNASRQFVPQEPQLEHHSRPPRSRHYEEKRKEDEGHTICE